MNIARRAFFGILGLGGIAAACAGYLAWRPMGPQKPLVTDPDGTEFVYRDGWIVKSGG